MLDFRQKGSEDGRSMELSRLDQVDDFHTRGSEYFNTFAFIIIIIIITALKRIKIYKLSRRILFFDDSITSRNAITPNIPFYLLRIS
jgi:hypothetical protein